MARLEGVAKACYYPTPPSVVERVAALIGPAAHSPRQAVRLFDPCLRDGRGAPPACWRLRETYCADVGRTEWTKRGSAFAVRLEHGAFACLWLNPPYDHDDESKRLEHAFLTTMTRALCPGGVLVFIVPQRRLAVSARYLAAHYTRFACCRLLNRRVNRCFARPGLGGSARSSRPYEAAKSVRTRSPSTWRSAW